MADFNSDKQPMSPKNISTKDFWFRRNWTLSNAIKKRAGNFVVTEARFKSKTSNKFGFEARNNDYVLIFNKLSKELDLCDPNKTVEIDTKLPSGMCIKTGREWEDFVRAFARYYMLKTSRSAKECELFFGFKIDDSRDQSFTSMDMTGGGMTSPKIDRAMLEYSEYRAAAMEEAINSMVSYEEFLDLVEEEPKPGSSKDDDDNDEVKLDDEEGEVEMLFKTKRMKTAPAKKTSYAEAVKVSRRLLSHSC